MAVDDEWEANWGGSANKRVFNRAVGDARAEVVATAGVAVERFDVSAFAASAATAIAVDGLDGRGGERSFGADADVMVPVGRASTGVA